MFSLLDKKVKGVQRAQRIFLEKRWTKSLYSEGTMFSTRHIYTVVPNLSPQTWQVSWHYNIFSLTSLTYSQIWLNLLWMVASSPTLQTWKKRPLPFLSHHLTFFPLHSKVITSFQKICQAFKEVSFEVSFEDTWFVFCGKNKIHRYIENQYRIMLPLQSYI